MFKKITIAASLFLAMNLNAQDYTFQGATTEEYTDLENAISINDGEIWDDPTYEVPIGFTINFNGMETDKIYFDESVGAEVNLTPSFENSILMLTYLDLIDKGDYNEDGVSLSPISYVLEGEEGSRIFKLEWKNAGIFDEDTPESVINIQLWIYEEDQKIEFHYGEIDVKNPETLFQGYETNGDLVMIGAVNQEENSEYMILLHGNASNPEHTIYNPLPDNEFQPESFDSAIPSNTVYTFVKTDYGVGVEEELLASKLNVFPNPVRESFTLNFDKTVLEIEKVEIYNTLGQKVKDFKQVEDKYSVRDLNSGNYLLKVTTDKGIKNQNLIIK
ncbi:T9SS type A sorting domain-containing protein [Aureivirga sp. CE67]|uniref:T9SS type A sorting domain-containing protein n=1 Tax=Aureivirga sp. CE67 TaxID=1788983 RepID=UPI0018C99BE4|nr:T9SS type A sorting domain-containing protein [Aureivirga sp. CE67]